MIEAKDKEQAVLELHRIYGFRPVVHESLRPPVKGIGVKISGRKGKLGREHLPWKPRGSKKKSEAVEEEGEDLLGDDGASSDEFTPAAKAKVKNPKSLLKAEQTIAKAKELAKRQGRDYQRPGAGVGEDEGIELTAPGDSNGEEVKSTAEMLEDMKREAEWVRAELRAERERRAFGQAESQDSEDTLAAVLYCLKVEEDGRDVVMEQGAPPDELVADHENILVSKGRRPRKKAT